MDIKPLKSEFNYKRRIKSGYDSAHPNRNVYDFAQLCENNKGYNVSFSGKLPNESVTAAKSFMEKIMSTGAFKWLTGFAGEHNVAAASLIALFLAGVLRPPITIALPGKKDMEDKIYAAGHSLASATIGFGFSTLITTPIDSGIKHIFKEANKMSKEDYNNLSTDELVEYIKKNNMTPDKIAEKLQSKTMPAEEFLKLLKDSEGKNLSPEKIAEQVKANNWEIISTRNPKNKFLTIISDKVDKINKLKHELTTTTDAMQKGKLLSEIRDLENCVKGINTSMHNVSEWAIAVPRAMLTIALIPPILKYVFHVEKKKEEDKSEKVQSQNLAVQNVVNINTSNSVDMTRHFSEFVGGKR